MNAADVEEYAKKYLVTIHQKLGKEYSHPAYVHIMGFMGYLKVMEQREGIE